MARLLTSAKLVWIFFSNSSSKSLTAFSCDAICRNPVWTLWNASRGVSHSPRITEQWDSVMATSVSSMDLSSELYRWRCAAIACNAQLISWRDIDFPGWSSPSFWRSDSWEALEILPYVQIFVGAYICNQLIMYAVQCICPPLRSAEKIYKMDEERIALQAVLVRCT